MSASLNRIVDVNVEVSTTSAISSDFNLGLIMGNSQTLSSEKVKIYTRENYATQMTTDGFSTSDAEYKAVVAYFAQSPGSNQVAVGCVDTSNAQTPQNALNDIRAANDRFYAVCFASGLTDELVNDVAAAVEAYEVPTILFYVSSDAKCIQSDGGIIKTLQSKAYTRTFAFYGTGENLAASIVGLFSGLNSMQVNSAYTLAYKTLSGVVADNLTDEQINTLTTNDGNAYCLFGNTYSFIYPAISCGGYHADELYLIDLAKFLIQRYTISGLIRQRKISYTEDGMSMLTSFVANACIDLLNIGLIAGGIWQGNAVKDLQTGDAIENGYYIASDSVASQTAEQRASRISPTIYVALLSSSAVEHVVIRAYVNR